MTHILSTDTVAPRQRVAFWQEMVCQTFVQAQCDSRIGASFRGRIRSEAFDQAEITRIDADPQRIRRRPVDIARVGKPHYYLCYHAAGHALYRERDAESLLGPGDMILLDNCEPYTAEYHESVSSLVLQVPHAVVRDRFRLPDRTRGHRISGAQGLPRIVGQFLQSCLTQADALSVGQRPAIANVALDLFTSLLAQDLGTRPDVGTHQALLVARTKQFIAAHLGEPGLDLAFVATAMGVSARHISRLFQRDGTRFGRYLLQQRVARCRLALANPALGGLHVGEIAFKYGFTNLAHFSRVFRAEVGYSPSDYRAAMRAGALSPGGAC